MKKNGTKIWRMVFILIVVICVVGAMLGACSDAPTSEQTASSSQQDKTAKTSSPQKHEFAQDEPIIFKDVKYTVTDVKKTTGDGFNKAKTGYEYIIVSIKIENNSSEKISYNPYDWKMENSNGQEGDITFTTIDTDTSLNDGNLNAGGKVEGTLTFEQPQGDTGLKLNYYSNVWFDDTASFKIKLK